VDEAERTQPDELETGSARAASRRTFLTGIGTLGLGGAALSVLGRGWVPVRQARPLAHRNALPGDEAAAHAQQSASGTFVGQVTDTDAFIGLTTDGQRVVAYVCNFTPQAADAATGMSYDAVPVSTPLAPAVARTVQGGFWFTGTSPDGQSALLSNPIGEQVLVGLSPVGVYGAVLDASNPANLSVTAFTTDVASGSAGLFRSQVTGRDGAPYVAGWIQLADGEQRGAITNQQTGAQVPAPFLTAADIAAGQVTVPGIGVLTLLNCQNGVCS
jgi:hypothetical protein